LVAEKKKKGRGTFVSLRHGASPGCHGKKRRKRKGVEDVSSQFHGGGEKRDQFPYIKIICGKRKVGAVFSPMLR